MPRRKPETREYIVSADCVCRVTQVCTVQATSEEDAIAKAKSGGDWETEDFEVSEVRGYEAELND